MSLAGCCIEGEGEGVVVVRLCWSSTKKGILCLDCSALACIERLLHCRDKQSMDGLDEGRKICKRRSSCEVGDREYLKRW